MTVITGTAAARESLRQIGVPRAAARVLAACAGASELCPELPLRDGLARPAFERLGGNIGHFDESELRCAAFRTFVIDRLARDFFTRTSGALGVAVWPILGTRGHRLHDVPWVDIDSPEVAELRRFVLPERPGRLQLGMCLCRPAWLDLLCGKARRQLLLVLDESVLPVAADSFMRFLDDVSRTVASGSELIVAFDAHTPLRPAFPLRRGSPLEVVVRRPEGEEIARYPRLRFVDGDAYAGDLGQSVAGVNAVATLHAGLGAPAIAHLRVV